MTDMIDNAEPVLKQCSNCQQCFEKATFPPGRARCRECYLAMRREHSSQWRSILKHKYNITPEMHEMMYEDQGGKCYFCDEQKPRRGAGGLAIDHIEKNGNPIVRGLLCRLCNANWVDEYRRLPKEYQDSPRTNAYLLRGETSDYIESIRQRCEAMTDR